MSRDKITLQLQLQLQSFTLQQIVLRGIMQCCRLVGTDEFSVFNYPCDIIFLIRFIMNFKTGVTGFIYTSLVGRLGLGAWSWVRIGLADN